jgi:hypothetical protein
MKTKSKLGFRWGSLRFMGVWTTGYIVAWMASLTLGLMFLSTTRTNVLPIMPYIFLAGMALGPALLQAAIQKWMVEEGLKRSMNGWLRVSLIGGIVSALALSALYTPSFPQLVSNMFDYVSPQVFLLAWLVPPTLAQAWWLRKRVHNAWLWGAIGLVNALMFLMPTGWRLPAFTGRDFTFIIVIGLLYGIITSTIMRHLWTNQKETANAEMLNTDDLLDAQERLALNEAEEEADLRAQRWVSVLRRDISAS